MRAPKKTGKKTAFVPRIVFKAVAAVSVIPLCAACGGTVIGQVPDDGGGSDVIFPSVALIMSDGGDEFRFTVAAECFDGGGPPCFPVVDAGSDVEFTVAATCFDGGPFCPPDAGVADVGFGDVFLGVAADAFAPDAGKKS